MENLDLYNNNFYAILGLKPFSSLDEVRKQIAKIEKMRNLTKAENDAAMCLGMSESIKKTYDEDLTRMLQGVMTSENQIMVENYQNLFEEYEIKLAELKDKIEGQNIELDEKSGELTELSAENSRLGNDNMQLAADIERLNKEKQNLELSLEKEREQLRKVWNDRNDYVTQLNDAKREAKKATKEADEKINELNKKAFRLRVCYGTLGILLGAAASYIFAGCKNGNAIFADRPAITSTPIPGTPTPNPTPTSAPTNSPTPTPIPTMKNLNLTNINEICAKIMADNKAKGFTPDSEIFGARAAVTIANIEKLKNEEGIEDYNLETYYTEWAPNYVAALATHNIKNANDLSKYVSIFELVSNPTDKTILKTLEDNYLTYMDKVNKGTLTKAEAKNFAKFIVEFYNHETSSIIKNDEGISDCETMTAGARFLADKAILSIISVSLYTNPYINSDESILKDLNRIIKFNADGGNYGPEICAIIEEIQNRKEKSLTK